ncbi:carbohydrate ABC transporter permease [Catelliglobosispora koreensis]|uniref:carbohydrate ABC transporter permease n=1 Tax=Catelliglobosispora koreensis TaxID=129052 RepID=UPI00036E45C1|nr:sugar ABC transporter permease [Catelliglobosispora koreensis]
MRHGKLPFVASFLALPIALYVILVIYPMLQTFYLSLTFWRGFDVDPVWVGFDNFTKLFDDERFWKALGNHAKLLVALPLITIAIALFFAFLLNVGGGSKGGVRTGVWGSKFYRVVFFLPQVLAVVIVGVLFQTVYRSDDSGLINGILTKIGLDPVYLLVNPSTALWAILFVAIWQAVGFYVVLFSAGMASIPAEIYEAAELDGASRVTLFFRVTLPLLWDTIQVAWVYLGIAAFDFFALINVLSQDNGYGGPDGATTVLGVELYNSFTKSNIGRASAIGVVLFFLTLTFAFLTLRASRRETVEY